MDKSVQMREALESIRDGMRIALGGMTLYRRPVAAAIAIAAEGRRNLEIITLTGGIETDLLIGAGCVKTLRSCYTGLEIAGFAPHFTRCVQNGSLQLIEETEYSLSYAVQAAAMRVPFLPMLGAIGHTGIVTVRPDMKPFNCPLTGVKLFAVPAIEVDVAILHATAADRWGNCNLQGQLALDTYLPMVARTTIVTAERVVSTDELQSMEGGIQIPGFAITQVVEMRGGSAPTSCPPQRPLDMNAVLDYADAAREPAAWAAWLAAATQRVLK